MATRAVIAELAIVGIVFGMAARAGHVEFAAQAIVAPVASGAGRAAMSLGKREVGLAIMVELP